MISSVSIYPGFLLWAYDTTPGANYCNSGSKVTYNELNYKSIINNYEGYRTKHDLLPNPQAEREVETTNCVTLVVRHFFMTSVKIPHTCFLPRIQLG